MLENIDDDPEEEIDDDDDDGGKYRILEFNF